MFSVPQTQDGIWQYTYANGMCIFLVSPIFISYLIYIARSIIKHERFDMKFTLLVLAIAIIELLSITAHKQWAVHISVTGTINDVLPIYIYRNGYVTAEGLMIGKFQLIPYSLSVLRLI